MDGALRSSKRRRLDDTASNESSPISTGTPDPSSRRRGLQGSHIITSGTPQSQKRAVRPTRTPKSSNSATKATREKTNNGVDVYDDIDGALGFGHTSNGRRNRQQNGFEDVEGLPNGVSGLTNGTPSISAPQTPRKDITASDGSSKLANGVTIPGRGTGSRTSTVRQALDEALAANAKKLNKSVDDREEGSPSAAQTPRRLWPTEYATFGSRGQTSSNKKVSTPGKTARFADQTPTKSMQKRAVGVAPRSASRASLDMSQAAAPAARSTKTHTSKPRQHMDQDDLDTIHRIVLEKLSGGRPIPLVGLENEFKKIYHVADQTVASGEGNSMLVIGARGSGKTTLLNEVVKKLAEEQMSEFHVIRLNGFVHTDDKIALREIWRQLGREMEVEDDGTGKSYADTLAKLLALLSHPSELSGQHSESVAKAVIFIMDEFDLFTTHARQTLLYNLFDIAQSRKAPIAVFGLTSRIDVAESLEKRVKSRFSHRYVHLSLARTPAIFQDMCKSAVVLQSDELSTSELHGLRAKSSAAAKTQSIASLATWNDAVAVSKLLNYDEQSSNIK